MAGTKESYTIELNPEHMGFIQSTKEKYQIHDDSKVVRIVMDYLLSFPDTHDTVFGETRCLRCG